MIDKKDYTLAVVGCGNIGSRLLQSAAAADVNALHVYGVEPFEAARDLSAERFAQIGGSHTLTMVDGMDGLPAEIDLLIIACSAHQRMDALSTALEHTKPRAVVLEKVLFTRTSDYAKAAKMLDGIPTWVNTTRNIWPGYVAFKETLSDAPITLDVSGSDWSLGSNAIHFLSLIEMLSDSQITAIDIANPVARDSKRSDYRDLTGVMTAALADGSSATIASLPGDGTPMSVTITQDGQRHVLDEGKGTRNGEPFKILFTSQLGFAMTEILTEKTSGLPTLAESSRLHTLYLDALRPHIHPQDANGDLCMVT